MTEKIYYPETCVGWKKYPENPVLGSREPGTCFDVQVTRQEEGGYRMVSFGKTGSLYDTI